MENPPNDHPQAAPEQWFGSGATKDRFVRGVFESVADRYDLMNDIMSMGVHRLWKMSFINMLRLRPSMRVLDMAGGTGDITFGVLERCIFGHPCEDVRVTVCDASREMLEVGRDRAIDRGRLQGIDWVCGIAEAVPLPKQTFDAYTIAFGLRNVGDLAAALSEATRLLKPGGRFLCLEFSHVSLPLLRRLYDGYSYAVIPRVGLWVAGDRQAYAYLVDSIRQFPKQEELAAMLEAVGLRGVRVRNLSGGIAAIHSGWRV